MDSKIKGLVVLVCVPGVPCEHAVRGEEPLKNYTRDGLIPAIGIHSVREGRPFPPKEGNEGPTLAY